MFSWDQYYNTLQHTLIVCFWYTINLVTCCYFWIAGTPWDSLFMIWPPDQQVWHFHTFRSQAFSKLSAYRPQGLRQHRKIYPSRRGLCRHLLAVVFWSGPLFLSAFLAPLVRYLRGCLVWASFSSSSPSKHPPLLSFILFLMNAFHVCYMIHCDLIYSDVSI